MNKGDIVFEKVSDDIYKMIANRLGKIDAKTFNEEEIEILSHKYKVEIR